MCLNHLAAGANMLFSLTSDQLAIRNMASEFAAEKLAPKAIEWDHTVSG